MVVVVGKVRGVGTFSNAGGAGQQAGARGGVVLQPVCDGVIQPGSPHKRITEQLCLAAGAVIDGQAVLQFGDLPAELPVFLAFQHGVQLRHLGIEPRLEYVFSGIQLLFPVAHIQPLSVADR